jgi:ABC-type transport system involved in multi-copper enzyme maturation permease subunit
MNALVKKEIRLLLPGFIVAVLLAMVQGITRPYDFYVASLLFFGLTIMALTTIGRETSLNTLSSLLAQPAERLRIWQTKLSVLVVAFVIVFVVWLTAFGIALHNPNVDASDRENSYNLFITICLVGTATFTGGLWTTLLLRQIAGAFWLTLLVPAVLAGVTAGFLVQNHSNNAIIAVLCVVLGIYSVGGFLFARWLFFRAQDVGWSGGIIALPEWKIFAGSENAVSTRSRKRIFALFKKELQLHQVTLMGAAGLLVLHIGIIALRKYHHFAKDSAGEVLTSIFWMLWLVMAPVIGSMAVAEERRLGVMEGQLCLPVSRRVQFAIKGISTLFLGIFLGGVMPMLLEAIGVGLGANNPVLPKADMGVSGVVLFGLYLAAFAAWLVLVSFFASTLAKSFLQAVGYAIGTCFGCTLLIPAFTKGHMIFFDSISVGYILPLIIAVPTIIVTLIWLAYLNFKNFCDGWTLWRRNILGIAGALVFVVVSSAAVYNRIWNVFEPAEPAHGPAKLTLANPPTLKIARDYNLLVRLPDGRVWFDMLGDSPYDYYGGSVRWKYVWQMLTHPLSESLGPQQFLSGSNWVAATTAHMYFRWNDAGKTFYASDFMETVGIQPDGRLWISAKPETNKWTPGTLQQFGSETNWRQLAQGNTSVVLLKTDGTLWRWGCLTNELHQWPGLRAFTPYQIGTNSDWQELFSMGQNFVRETNGGVWLLSVDWKTGRDELIRETNYDEIALQTASRAGDNNTAFVRADGTLWVLNRYWDETSRQTLGTGILQVGKENGWRAVAVNWRMMVALKADGSLWQWQFKNENVVRAVNGPPIRLGIHNDWVAIMGNWGNVIALAADGSLWLWPDKISNDYNDYGYEMLIKLPKQPQFLGNVFGKTN